MLDFGKVMLNDKHHKGVYAIPCSRGKIDIGEIGCLIQTRVKEHGVDIANSWIKRSTPREHSCKIGHHICIKDARVTRIVDHYVKRCMREVLEIEMLSNKLNKEDGWKISEMWKPFIQTLKK